MGFGELGWGRGLPFLPVVQLSVACSLVPPVGILVDLGKLGPGQYLDGKTAKEDCGVADSIWNSLLVCT